MQGRQAERASEVCVRALQADEVERGRRRPVEVVTRVHAAYAGDVLLLQLLEARQLRRRRTLLPKVGGQPWQQTDRLLDGAGAVKVDDEEARDEACRRRDRGERLHVLKF